MYMMRNYYNSIDSSKKQEKDAEKTLGNGKTHTLT